MKIEEQIENKLAGLFPFFRKLVAATFATNILFLVEYDFSGDQTLGWLSQAAFLVSCLTVCFYYLITERVEVVNTNNKLHTLSVKFIDSIDLSLIVLLVFSGVAITLALFSADKLLGVFWLLILSMFFGCVFWMYKIENKGEKVKLRKAKTKAAPPPAQNIDLTREE